MYHGIEIHIVNGFTILHREDLHMNTRVKNEKTQVQMKSGSDERINPNLDRRVQMIYDRYRTGKAIIIDDLKYLWSKDPEGCEKLARSIINAKTGKSPEPQPNAIVSYSKGNSFIENTKEQQNYIDYRSSADTPVESFHNVQETMKSVKLIIERMNENERMDMLKNLNESLTLSNLANNMKYWDDSFTDKMVMYTYEEEKEFNIMA